MMISVGRCLFSMLLVVASLFQAERAGADALLVPQDYPTIGQAIAAAQDGDVIQVGPGVFYENLSVVNKEIAIRGEETDGVTIIDGGNAKGFFGSCVVVGIGAELAGDTKLILDSVVLRNGRGVNIFGIRRGGGIYAEYAEVDLTDVVIENCSVELDKFGQDCWGGAVCNYSGVIVANNCIFRDNLSEGQGGAIWSSFGTVLITNSAIAGNQADRGGGIYLEGGMASIERTSFCGNSASERGGGLYSGDMSRTGEVSIETCRFDSNTAVRGAAIWFNMLSALLGDSVIARNTASEDDGAIHIVDSEESDPVLIGDNFFCGSTGSDYAGGGSWKEFEPNTYRVSCPELGDFDDDGTVSGADLTILLSAWGSNGLPYGADLNCDGIVNGGDLTVLLSNWSS